MRFLWRPALLPTACKGRYTYYRCQQRGCRSPAGVSRPPVDRLVVDSFLYLWPAASCVRGEGRTRSRFPTTADGEAAIADTLAVMREDDADVEALVERLMSLKNPRSTVRAEAKVSPQIR
jgi:hypothetical protein